MSYTHCINVIEDANFLVSVLNTNDIFHQEAVDCKQNLLKCNLVFIYPDIVLKETIFTLLKAGFSIDLVRARINRLSMIPKVILQMNDILSILRFMSDNYNFLTKSLNGHKTITKTNDYIIACNALDYNAKVISGDTQLLGSLNDHRIYRDCTLVFRS